MPSQFGGIPLSQSNAQKTIDVFDPDAAEATPPKSKFGGTPATASGSKFGGVPTQPPVAKSKFGGIPVVDKPKESWLTGDNSIGGNYIDRMKGLSADVVGNFKKPLDKSGALATIGDIGGRVGGTAMDAMNMVLSPAAAASDTAIRSTLPDNQKNRPEVKEAVRNASDLGVQALLPGKPEAEAVEIPKPAPEVAPDVKSAEVAPKEPAQVHPIEAAYKETYPAIKARDYDPAQHGASYVFNDGTMVTGKGTVHEEMAEPVFKKLGLPQKYGDRAVHAMDTTGAMRVSGFPYKDSPILFESGQGFTPRQISRAAEIIKNNPERKIEFWDREKFAGTTPTEVAAYNKKLAGGGKEPPKFQSKIFSPDQPIASTHSADTVQGVADKLYQQRNAIRADYKEFSQWAKPLKAVPKEFWQKALDHLDDPKGVPLTPEEKLIFDRSIKPMEEEINANRAKIKATGIDPNRFDDESGSLGGAIRVRKGMDTPLDKLTGTKTAPRALEGGRSLSRTAGTFKGRNMMALVKDGKRQIVHIDPDGQIFDAAKKGEPIGRYDSDAQTVSGGGKLVEATRKEIENATGGEVAYHDNAFGVYGTTLLQTRRALRSVQALEDIKKSPDFNMIARGPGASMKDIPKDWKEIPNAPEFRGYRFGPRYAEEIEDFLHGAKFDAGELNKLDRLNRFTLNTMFWANPYHIFNMNNAFIVTKGLGGLLKDVPGTASDMLKAIKSVATRDKFNMQQTRAGVPMRGLDTAGEDFRKMTLDVMGVKMRQDPKAFAQFAKRYGFNKAADFYQYISRLSHKATFSWQDVLQQTLERGYRRQGLTQAQATEKAAKTFMNYRTPARVGDQRWIGQALQGQAWLNFPKYAYGRLNGMYNILKDSSKLDPHALDQLATIGVLYEFGQHVINPWLKQATGNDKAEMSEFGYEDFPGLAAKTMQGGRTAGQDIQSLLSPGYMVQAADLARGIIPFTGKAISQPGESASQVGFDYLNQFAGRFSPVQKANQLARGQITPKDLWLEQLGVKFPTDPQELSSVRKALNSRNIYGNPTENFFKRLTQ